MRLDQNRSYKVENGVTKKASVGWRPRSCQESAGCTVAYLASIPQEVFDVEIQYQYLSMSDCHVNEAPLTPNCNTFWRHTPLAQCDFFNPLHFTTGISFETCHKMLVLMTWTSFRRPNVSLLSKWLTIYATITFMFSHFMPSCVSPKDVKVSFRSVSSNLLFCPHSCSTKTRVAIMNFLCENYDT